MKSEQGYVAIISGGLLLLLLCSCYLQAQTRLTLLTEHSPPGQYIDQQGKVSGVTVALMRELQQRLDEPGEIGLLPWGRALSMAKSGQSVGLFETVRTPKREHWFKWVGPLMHYNITLYGIRQRLGVDATSLLLPGKLIACSYRNAATAQDVQRFGFEEGRNLVLTSQTGECLDMLILGRVDLIAITEYSLKDFSQQVDAAGFNLTSVRHLTERKRYLAFSPDVADSRVARWQKALEQSYRDGTMRSLYQPVYADVIIQRLEEFAAQQQ